ncbi:MAG TPA: 2,3-bisphosphoglycerate-independent phosphoglycerate mutase [Candidatus Nanoarchaeia archaeon]|nr:2,3-bisphosphoglycerate-independent phosphoglycerate mutase [Candidatus Nanoarchaeia archaeon]
MKKVMLVIRDGWGYKKSKKDNALANSKTPYTDFLMKEYPNILLEAHDGAVGLPKKYQGNSEVGHMTLGSGRIIEQSLIRINKSIKNKSFFKNKTFLDAISNAKQKKSKLHIIGLIQEEGVHAHLDHLFALLDLSKQENFYDVILHLITDGRDSPVNKGIKYLKKIKKKIKKIGFGKIQTISGRYYAMDRDKRWNRTKKAYEAIALGKSKIKFKDEEKTILQSYNKKITDEFIIPRVKEGYDGIKDKDSVIFYNYRTDRARQLTRALSDTNFKHFKRKKINAFYVSMTEYYKPIKTKVAFYEPLIKNNLGQIISKNKLKQLRISETEKYAHVTFFFNSQIEKPNKGEDRIIIPSPKVATYDKKPEMSVYKISETLKKEIKKEKYNLIVTNLVNGDMVGHTANVPAIKKACEAVDKALKEIVKEGLKKNYDILICADHGNAEDQSPGWETSHTMNPIPLILVSKKEKLMNSKLKKNKGLQDIAPTILDLFNIKKPKEMTGNSLIK